MSSTAAVSFSREFILGAKDKAIVPTECGHRGCRNITEKRCGGCHIMYFCKKECQKAAWKYHKNECRQFQSVVKREIEVNTLVTGTGHFQKYFQENPTRLNLALQKRSEYFLSKEERRRRSDHLKKLYFWVRDTFEPKGYRVDIKLNCRTVDDWVTINRVAIKNTKRIFVMQFDFKNDWCIYLANMKAAQGELVYQRNPARMAAGFHILVGDNFVEGSFARPDEEMVAESEVYKLQIAKAVGSVGKFESCAICCESLVSEVKMPCAVCKNTVCRDCLQKLINKVTGKYKCPYCRNEV